MKSVNMLDAKNNLSRLVAEATQGEDVVIANRGKPVVRLVPVAVEKTNTGAALAEWLTRNPLVRTPERTTSDIEAQLQEIRESWR